MLIFVIVIDLVDMIENGNTETESLTKISLRTISTEHIRKIEYFPISILPLGSLIIWASNYDIISSSNEFKRGGLFGVAISICINY